MSSPARPIITTALALISAAGVVGADLSLSVIPVDARTVRGRSERSNTESVRMRLLRSDGQIAIAVDLSGNVDRVNQRVFDSSWNGTITADQKQRSITGENRFVIPELGNAEVSSPVAELA